MKKLTRDLVVPTIAARVSWVIAGINVTDPSASVISAINKSALASLFSLELKR
jgi:hypothetical protein